jgi:hypothetical protein
MKGLVRAERINWKPVDPNLRQSSISSEQGANEWDSWEVTVSRIFSLYLSAGAVLSHMLPTLRPVRHLLHIIVGVVAALGGVFRHRGS